jgi:hypothetical protein
MGVYCTCSISAPDVRSQTGSRRDGMEKTEIKLEFDLAAIAELVGRRLSEFRVLAMLLFAQKC